MDGEVIAALFQLHCGEGLVDAFEFLQQYNINGVAIQPRQQIGQPRLDGIDVERSDRNHSATLKLFPQPHDDFALGFLISNAAAPRVST